MADPLRDVLGIDNIVGVISTTTPGLPAPLAEGYYAVNRSVEGDMVGFDHEGGERKTAPIVDRSSPSRHVIVDGMGNKQWRMLTAKHNSTIDPNALQNLRTPGSLQKQKNGRAEVARVAGRLAKRLINTRTMANHAMLLGGGKIYVGPDGDLQPASAGSMYTVDAEIPASNLDQGLQMDAATALLTTSWNNAAADIPAMMQLVTDTALMRTGIKLDLAVIGANVLGYFLANTMIKELMKSNVAMTTAFGNNTIPNEFLGVPNWMKGSGLYWVDKDDGYNKFVGDDDICLLPAPAAAWLECAEGSHMLTNGGQVVPSMEQANEAFVEVYGKWGFAELTSDPTGAKLVAGDTYLPMLKIPAAVYKLDVKF